MTCKFDRAPLLLAAGLAFISFHALATPQILSISENVHVREFDGLGNTVQDPGVTAAAPSGTKQHIDLGDGRNVFSQPAFAEAFAALPNGTPSYWISLSSDSSFGPIFLGNGGALVDVSYRAIKRADDDTIVLHITGGLLQLLDDDFGRLPLSARVDLHATAFTGDGIFSNFDAFAALTGNAGQAFNKTFDFTSSNLGVTQADFILQNFGSSNIVGATLQIPKIDIPVDLSNLFVGTEFRLDVTLSGEVRSPGGEVVARAFLRDPAHINDADPLSGALSITLSGSDATPPPGPSASVPEPSTASVLAVVLPAVLALRRRRGRPGPGDV
jgi:hypothetical protein